MTDVGSPSAILALASAFIAPIELAILHQAGERVITWTHSEIGRAHV